MRAAAGSVWRKGANRMQGWFEDTGAFTGFAVAFLVLGSLFLLAAVQSPSMLQWTGTAVRNVESGGIAYYSFNGQTYTLNVPSPQQWSSTIYLDPADPSIAMFSNPLTRWTDFAAVGGSYAASVLLLVLGFARKSRRRRRRLQARGPRLSVVKGAGSRDRGSAPRRQREL